MAESTDLTGPEALRRLCVEVTPLHVGHRVKVRESHPFAADWPGDYVITGIHWDYQLGAGNNLNISIASDDDIVRRNGDTDGWRPDDLYPARKI